MSSPSALKSDPVLSETDAVSILLRQMGDLDTKYEAGEKLNAALRSQSPYRITQQHLSIIAQFKSPLDVDLPLSRLIYAESGARTPPSPTQERLRELAELANGVEGPQKNEILRTLEKFGLVTPAVQAAIDAKNAAEAQRVEGMAQTGVIASGPFKLVKENGILVLTEDGKPVSIKDAEFGAVKEARLQRTRPDLRVHDLDNVGHDLEKAVATGHGSFTKEDLRSFQEQVSAGNAQCRAECGPEPARTRGPRF